MGRKKKQPNQQKNNSVMQSEEIKPSTSIFHLIDGNKEFLSDLNAQQKFENEYLMSQGRNYHVIGIIGNQTTGKSTLLNELFGTGFRVRSSNDKHFKCTQGIWAAHNEQSKVLVLDVEGSDAEDNDREWEARTALFALIFSNILMINLKTAKIGQDNGSNRPMIRRIFRYYLDLDSFLQEKTILFVLRDYDPSQPRLKHAEKILFDDTVNLWKDALNKTDFKGNTEKETFFKETYKIEDHIKCFPIASKYDNPPGFEEHARDLKQRLKDPSNGDYYLGFVNPAHTNPYDGLYKQMSSIWEAIKKNEKIDIENTSKMVAEHMVDQKIKEIMGSMNLEINRFGQQVTNDSLENPVNFSMIEKINKSCRVVKNKTGNYNKEITNEKINKMIQELEDKLLPIGKESIRIKGSQQSKNFGTSLKIIDDQNVEEISKNVNKRQFEFNQQQDTQITESTITENADREWQPHYDFQRYTNEYAGEKNKVKEAFNLKLNQFYKDKCELFIEQKLYEKMNELEKEIGLIFGDINKDFWTTFIDKFNQKFVEYRNEIDTLISCDQHLSSVMKDQEYIREIKSDFYTQVKEKMQKHFKMLKDQLLKIKFNKLFWRSTTSSNIQENDYATKDQNKKWRDLSLEEIKVCYKNAKTEIDNILNNVETAQFVGWEDQQAEDMISKPDFESLKKEVENEMDQRYQKAKKIRIKKGKFDQTTIPIFIWVIIAVLARNDILSFVMSPVVWPLLVIIGFLSYFFITKLKELGYYDMVLNLVREHAPAIHAVLPRSVTKKKVNTAGKKPKED